MVVAHSEKKPFSLLLLLLCMGLLETHDMVISHDHMACRGKHGDGDDDDDDDGDVAPAA